jgi:hypothetical protein
LRRQSSGKARRRSINLPVARIATRQTCDKTLKLGCILQLSSRSDE